MLQNASILSVDAIRAEAVIEHARRKNRRGRNPSMSFQNEKNPRKAITKAMEFLSSKDETPEGMVSIKRLNKAAVLAALFNSSHPQGLGFIHYSAEPMSIEVAEEICATQTRLDFDYLQGRVLKVDISGDWFNPSSYDRDNSPGAAEKAVNELRTQKDVISDEIHKTHVLGTLSSLAKMTGSSTLQSEADFRKLADKPERIQFHFDINQMLLVMSDGDPKSIEVMTKVLDYDLTGFMILLGMDTNKLYGSRIWELYSRICGEDIERFVYHLSMELPNQGTGQLSITGPYATKMSEEEEKAFWAARMFGKPGSFWALEDPPTDPHYEYPIKVK